MQIGERALLPAARNAAPETLIVADGFSCQTQIVQGTGRKALHLAQVLHMRLRENGGLPDGGWYAVEVEGKRGFNWPLVAKAAIASVGGYLAWQLLKETKT